MSRRDASRKASAARLPKSSTTNQASSSTYESSSDLIESANLTMSTDPSTIGIIGMGLMGSAFQKMTAAARGWDIEPERCLNAVNSAQVFEHSEIIFLCLPNSEIVHHVLADAELRPGQIIIDTSTGDPRQMAAMGAALSLKGVHYLDATVSGSSAQLLRREVLLMVGGDAAVYERCRGLFSQFSHESIHIGPCGSGAKMKLVTNLVLGLNRAALAEGLAFSLQLELDAKQVLEVMRRSMAYSRIMDTKGEKMITGDFSPQAKLSQHLKDVRLMFAVSPISLPLSEAHLRLLEKAVTRGWGEADNSAVIQAILEP
jgi:3-hydroxyisobutyrate dehydrogenase-like beta-hydroxyacid dehydrogenase